MPSVQNWQWNCTHVRVEKVVRIHIRTCRIHKILFLFFHNCFHHTSCLFLFAITPPSAFFFSGAFTPSFFFFLLLSKEAWVVFFFMVLRSKKRTAKAHFRVQNIRLRSGSVLTWHRKILDVKVNFPRLPKNLQPWLFLSWRIACFLKMPRTSGEQCRTDPGFCSVLTPGGPELNICSK